MTSIAEQQQQQQPTSSTIENAINSVLGGVLSYTTLQPLNACKYDDEQSNTIHSWKRSSDEVEVARIMGQFKQGFGSAQPVHINQITLDIDAHVLRLPNWREHDLQVNVKLPNNQYVSITIPKQVFDGGAPPQPVTVHATHANRVVSTSNVLPCLQDAQYDDEESQDRSRSIEVPESSAFVAETGDVRYRCERCQSWGKEQVFAKQHALKRHIATKHLALDVLQACAQCNRKFLCKRELAAHVHRAHTQPRRFACAYCTQKFIQRNHLDRHLKNIHNATAQPIYADQVKPDNIQYVLVDHELHAFDNGDDTSPSRSSQDYTPQYATTQHDQSELSLELKSADTLPEDFDVVDDDDDDDYGAEDLPADFVPSGRSKYHKLNHMCQVCKQRFSRPKRLRQHLYRIHNMGEADPMDSRRFPCPSCGLTFSRQSNARRHLREGLCKADSAKTQNAAAAAGCKSEALQ